MTHTIHMPVKCVWGNNCVKESTLLPSLGKRCLIVTGKNSARLCGALDDAVEVLK